MMTRYAYDIECFQNLFTVTFANVEKDNDNHVFCIGLGMDDRAQIIQFLKGKTLVGYNSHSYDDPMLRYIETYKGNSLVADLFSVSSRLVDDNFRNDSAMKELRYPRKVVYEWESIDLMRIMAFDRLGVSLKQVAISLKWHKIQDMPVNHLKPIHESQLTTVLSYNLNDVLITKELYDAITDIRNLRDDLSLMFGINLSSASDSRVANLILEKIYTTELKRDIRSIRDLRTTRDKVLLGTCFAKFVKFQTPQLNEMRKRVASTFVYEYNNYKYSEKIYFANNTFALGVGGLHSEDAPGVFETDDKYIIRDMDVASYYPNLIINNKFYPQHLGEEFIDVLKKITSERLTAKAEYEKLKSEGKENTPEGKSARTKNEGLKITINSIFGKLGSKFFWLLDAKQFLSTTVSGQMGLLMLIEDLYLNGIEVISCNTDGVVCRIPRELEDKYFEIAKQWEEKTNLKLEFTTYKKYVRRDVNSYITQKDDGKTKEKGAFVKKIDLKKAYHMPIVPKALYEYFINNINVKETLSKSTDIMDFCISQKTGGSFIMELHTINGIEELQKTNRFFVSKKGGSLIKRRQFTEKRIGLYVGKSVIILNDYDKNTPFQDYEVDLTFYETEVMKIIDEIEPKQLNLFDLSDLQGGNKTKMEVPESAQRDEEEENLSYIELNKLGRLQFAKKIESIVNNNKMIENISPRFVYVAEFNSRDMVADVYCLLKGTYQTIFVDKNIYKKASFEKGQVIFCTKFQKSGNGYTLVDLKISEKLEEDYKKLF